MFILSYLVLINDGCVISPQTFVPYDFHEELQNQTFEQKLNQLVIVLDASISMIDPYMGQEKFQTAILTLHHMNAALSNIQPSIGFYVLGTGACHFCEKAKPLFHISPYQESRLDISHLKKINPGGETPLHIALEAVNKEFQSRTGKMGLIIISDFEIKNAQIKNALIPLIGRYGSRLSIGCLTVGKPERKMELSKTLTSLHPDIRCLYADDLLAYNELKKFVHAFFLQPVFDQDLDRVPDQKDLCEKTPLNAWVDATGCPKDSDGDGVFDGLDQCENTYKGADIDENGCWQIPVLFYEQNQFFMTRKQEKRLDSFSKIIEKNNICIEIQGHADSSGSKQKNEEISYKRAQSVKAYLLSLGLRHYQMKIKVFGESIPMDHRHALMKNATQRRVTFEVIECKNR